MSKTEKLSEQNIRKEKIEKLKEKLNKQITEKTDRILVKFRTAQYKAGDEKVRVLSTKLHNLFILQDYLGWDDTFNHAAGVCVEKDRVVYQLDIDTIDWMLNEEFLLNNILRAIERTGECAEIVLSDTFFQYEVCSVLDKVIWQNKQEARDGE
ncbi:MAG: hypothetical protein UGF89_08690 [Acutalibacteraceae bacterium]|nr:hypothetical protein [Acutalibacteraceae bacterium]